jgi:hypothetical protein
MKLVCMNCPACCLPPGLVQALQKSPSGIVRLTAADGTTMRPAEDGLLVFDWGKGWLGGEREDGSVHQVAANSQCSIIMC